MEPLEAEAKFHLPDISALRTRVPDIGDLCITICPDFQNRFTLTDYPIIPVI